MKTRVIGAAFILVLLAASFVAAGLGRDLTAEDWKALNKGEIVKAVEKEGGTQSGAWSAGLFDYPPETMWKVIGSLELYDDYMDRTTVSLLLDEETKDKVVEAGDVDADEVEKLLKDNKAGYKKEPAPGKWTVYSYQRNDFPWPVSDRWVLLEISHDDKEMLQTWKRLAGNIKEDYGSWKLGPAEGGKTLAINEIHIDLDIPATGPFTAFAMDKTLPDTYKYFKVMAESMSKKAQ